MSSVDNRIVRMQFDNDQFEAGVAKSMKSLDELTSKLQFKEAGKGISALQVALNGVDFGAITSGVQRLEHTFTSVTGLIGQRIKTDIVDQIEGAVKKLWNSTIGQAKSGGWARAMNIANAQFTIEGLKYSWEEVRKAADYAVTDTAYGLDQAAKAASQLAASGVDFQKVIGKDGAGNDVTQMHKSLRAISGVAAMTNSSYDEISHVFTRIAGQGRVMANDLNSIAARGINAAAALATHFGTTEAEIRDLVSKGEISFQMFSEAMDDAFGDHAKEANKTFNGALSNMKAALSRIGAIFAQPVVDKTNTFFIALTSQIKKFQKALSDGKEEILSEKDIESFTKKATKEAAKAGYKSAAAVDYITKRVKQLKEEAIATGKTETKVIPRFATHFAEAWEAGIAAASKFIDILDVTWFDSVGSFLDGIAVKATKVFKAFSEAIDRFIAPIKKAQDAAKGATGAIKDNLELDLQDLDLLHRILKNEFGYMEHRWKMLDDIYAKGDSGKTGKWLQGYMDQLAGVGYNFEKLGWTEEEFKKKQEEAAKSEAQRVKEMSAQEVLIQGMTDALTDYYNGMQSVKSITSNVFGTILSIGKSAAEVLYMFVAGIKEGGLSFSSLAALAEPLSGAIKELAEALKPTEEELSAVCVAVANVSKFIYEVVSKIVEAITYFVKFSAQVIAARENLNKLADSGTLTPIEESAVNVVRALVNMAKVIKNIARFVGQIAKVIIKAFMKVFKPSGILSGLGDFTEGLAGLSEHLNLTERAATALQTVIEIIFTYFQTKMTILSKIGGWIVKFIGNLGKTKNATKQLGKTFDDAGTRGKKASGVLDNLGKIAKNLAEKFKKVPGQIRDFIKAVKETEGVQRLKKALEGLWTAIKSAASKAVGPMNEGLSELVSLTGASGQTKIGTFANGIGIIADKIAGFVEKLPGYGQKIADFVDGTIEKVQKMVDDLHIGEFFTSMLDNFDITFDNTDTVITKVKKTGVFIGDQIVAELKKVDWLKTLKGGILGIIFADLFNVFKATDEIYKFMANLSKIPGGIATFITNINTITGTINQSVKKLTTAYIILTIARAILAIAGSIALLAEIPQDKLKTGLAAVTWVAFIIWVLGKAIEAMTRHAQPRITQTVGATTNTWQLISVQFGGLFVTLIAAAAVVGSIYLLLKAFADTVKLLEGVTDKKTIGNALIIVGGAVAAVVIIAATAAIIAQGVHLGNKEVKTVAALGVAMLGFGVAVLAIAAAMYLLNGIDIKIETVMAIVGILSALTLVTVAIGYAMKGANWKSTLAFGAVLFTFAIVLAGICAALVILSALMNDTVVSINKDSFTIAAFGIAVVLLALGGSIALMGSALEKKDFKAVKALALVLLSMAAVIAVITASLVIIAREFANNDVGMIVGMTTMITIVTIIALMVVGLAKEIARMNRNTFKIILSFAAVFAAIGVALLAIGFAMKVMAGVPLEYAIMTCGILIILVAAVGLVLLEIKKMGSVQNHASIADTLYAVGAALLLMAASVFVIAAAAKELVGVGVGPIVAVVAILIVFAGLIVGLTFLLKNPAMATGFEKAAKGIVMFGAAFLLLGAGMWLSAKAMEIIANIGTKLAKSIGEIAGAIGEHWPIFLGIIAILALVTVAIVTLARHLGAIVPAIFGAVGSVITAISTGITALFSRISTAGSSFRTWWNSATPKIRTMLVSLIVTGCAALIKAGPQLVETAKKLIVMVIKFIIDIIPTLADGLIDILLKLINALADKIRQESAAIARALWNVVEALLEVLIDLIGDAFILIFGALESLPVVGDMVAGASDAVKGSMMMIKGSLREGMSAIDDYTDRVENANDLIAEGWELNQNGVDNYIESTKTAESYGASFYTTVHGEIDDENIYTSAGNKADDASLQFQALRSAATEAAQALGEDVPQAAKDAYINSMTTGPMATLGAGYLKKDSAKAGKEAGETANNELLAQPWKKTGTESGEQFGGGLIGGVQDMVGGDQLDPNKLFAETGMDGSEYGEMFNENAQSELSDPQGYYEAETDNTEGTIKAVKDAKDPHKEAVKEYINDPGVAMVRGSYRRYYEAQEYAISGVVKAARDGEENIAEAMQRLVGVGLYSFMGPRGLDENSPSKKTYEAGKYAVLGFVNAILKNESIAGNAMTNLSGTVLDAFGNPMDQVARMATGEIAYDPTIRPVLDTSTIARGAYGINSMFNNQNVTLAGLSGQLAADIGQLDSRNSDVVAELQALREEMSYLSDDIQQMQVVMDTGALVGTMAGPMDKAMGRRAIYRGRGN